MKLLKLNINSCKECPYCFKSKCTGTPFSYCEKMGEELWGYLIEDLSILPEWCPLEDKE